MITRDNTKTIYDLTANAGALHGDKIFLRWEDNDVIREVSFKEFSAQCAAIASWTRAQEARLGRKIHVALLGGSSNHYLAVLLGVMCAGSVSVPLDIQVSLETLCDCLDRSDVDVLLTGSTGPWPRAQRSAVPGFSPVSLSSTDAMFSARTIS